VRSIDAALALVRSKLSCYTGFSACLVLKFEALAAICGLAAEIKSRQAEAVLLVLD